VHVGPGHVCRGCAHAWKLGPGVARAGHSGRPQPGDHVARAAVAPAEPGPFPAVLFNHGSGRTPEEFEQFGPYERQADLLGPVFARHGYVFPYLFRRGVGLSADQGTSSVDVMNSEFSGSAFPRSSALVLRHMENRNDAQRAPSARLRILNALLRVCPKSGSLIVKSSDFPVEFDKGDGLKSVVWSNVKSRSVQVLNQLIQSVCGEVAERLKAAVC
jgi:hypothetical protein